jgi:hypothetical protein
MRGQLGAAPADEDIPADTADPADASQEAVVRGGPLGWLATAPGRLKRTVRVHWQFSLVVLAAVIMRVIVMVGFPPIMWFDDSFNYFSDAITHVPDYVRPNGYSFFLSLLLLPLHSMYPVALLQAAMGLGMGIAIYALLRHRGLPWWGAALPTLPVLFDVFELQLEHMVTADTLFIFLVTMALVICCWRDRPSVPAMAVAGLLIGYATLVRSVGQPLLVVFVVGMLARWIGWRRLVTLTVAGIIPIAAYMGWFHHTSGKYALTESSGTFLYSRVSTFAECSKMNPAADLRVLCDPTPTYDRPPSQEYLWADNELWPDQKHLTPLAKVLGTNNAARFTPQIESLTQRFAQRAILAQPYDYVRVVFKDTMHTFGWNRQPDPHNVTGNGPHFRFSDTPAYTPWWALPTAADVQANALNLSLHKYLGGSMGQPRAIHPWAGFVQWYQRYVYLRGTLLGVIVLIGAAGVAARWRRWGGLALLPWLVGALLIVLPPMTAGFSYRYVVAAIPAACLAAGLAFTRRPGERSVRALAANLGRYFGRGVPVKQE